MPKCGVVDPPSAGARAAAPRPAVATRHLRGAREGFHRGAASLPDPRGSLPASRNPRVIAHLVRLGVTAVELMPIQAFFDDRIWSTRSW